MKTILRAEEVTKRSGDTTILNRVNIEIKEAECVAVMGPSGCGKSTLLYNISGMDVITEGSVTLMEQELSTLSEKKLSQLRLHKMGFVFQHIHLLKNLSLMDNIVLPGYLAKNESRTTINKRAMELMEKMGVSHLANHDMTEASGGQLQRVAICRALINNPAIVFADEPTGALHSKSTNEVIDLLVNASQLGTAVLLVTHDVKVAAKANRVLFMLDGDIVGETRFTKDGDRVENLKEREATLTKWLMKIDF
ncbi:ABC transporter ATP-binding protein [Alkalihalobacterium bogoriense]|uniref:ABC transporter ATP-binding protein n=1 Tax=Alkalihalobacterium bogoriense TaxID=246272 RepID=UPI00047BBAB5|nr:ABC transporter ATP-binding protein [Alkalihalobacterium bogoriense]